MINEYVHERKIGAGSYGKVVLYRSSIDGNHYAIKAFHKSHLLKLRVAPSETAMTDVHREETSVLKSKLLEHGNLVRYTKNLKTEFIEAGSSSSVPQFPLDPSSSAPRKGPSHWSSKHKPKPKREKTEEERTFRKRAKYFLSTQLFAIVLFLSVMNIYDISEPELDNDDDIDFD